MADVAGKADARPGRFVRLRVQDEGEGLTSEAVGRIFEPFGGRPLEQGADLGLPWAHGLVNQHHGWIECHSCDGAGTRFDIYLPQWLDDQAAQGPRGRPYCVLVAEEDETLRRLAAAYLQQAGYTPLLAGDLAEAEEVFRRDHGAIDLLILDHTLLGPPAAQAIRQFRQLSPALQIIVAGAGSRPAAVADVAGFITRPYQSGELWTAVALALQQK
jgi:CheY-like chemotaxis protein